MGFQMPSHGIQSMLKEGHKHFSGLDEAVLKNIDACKQLSTITRTSLGPNGMNKMVINHLDKLFVTNDAATIVNELEVQHPAAKLLVLAGKAQQEEIGDGANLTISFAGELLQNAEELIRMGLHPSEIISGYTKGINKTIEVLKELVEKGSENMDVRNKEEVVSRMKAAVASKQFGQEDFICSLVADACIQVCPKNPENFNVDNVRVAKLLGGGLHNSSVVRGMVLKSDAVGSIKRIEKAKVAVFAGGVDTSATETKGTVLIHTAEELQNYAKTEEAKVEELIKAVADSGAKVIVSGAAVGEMALHFCERYKLMVLKISSKFELRRFCRTTGAVAMLKLSPPNPDDLGHVDSVSVEEIGGVRVTVVKNEEGGNSISTVVLRGSTDSILDDLERAVDDGVNTYKAMAKDSRTVPGAAATEIELARRVKEFSFKETGLDQYAIAKFAESFEMVPKTLSENAGLNAMEIISSLYAEHASGNTRVGIDLEEGICKDVSTMNIWDLYITKFFALKYAADAVCTVLRVDGWSDILLKNDLVNANTGVLDPRHMYGVTNQDVFRWPAIHQGVERMVLGQFMTSLVLPGIPLVLWGEEQAFYVLDNTADNYIFGRQAMSASPAWRMHGCYVGSSTQYFQMPLEKARDGCRDETNAYDHRDPSHPVRNILKHLFFLREQFPVLNDGLLLSKLSKQTHKIQLPGSGTTETELGIWGVWRGPFQPIQDFGNSTTPVWLVYHNVNETTTYKFDCTNGSSFDAPFPAGMVRNLIFPHDNLTLVDGPEKLGIDGSEEFNGCAKEITLDPFEFRAYVPTKFFVPPPPMITRFLPGHDQPILSDSDTTEVNITLEFSASMSCSDVTKAISINSTTESGATAKIDEASVSCTDLKPGEGWRKAYVGAIASAFSWNAKLTNLADGVHKISVQNATTADLGSYTNTIDNFLLRVGKADNPIVWPSTGNYSKSLLSSDATGQMWITQRAPGADMFRYSLSFGSSWSNWEVYKPGNVTLKTDLPWSGTPEQAWEGHNVMVQYWSKLLGSSSFMQQGDDQYSGMRRFPHLWANGKFNQFGYDGGYKNALQRNKDDLFEWHYMDEWPGQVQLNVWGMNPDGQPDATYTYGDIDGDGVLDRLAPSLMVPNVINVTHPPPFPYLSYKMVVSDGDISYRLVPQGDSRLQLAFFILMWIVPIATGLLAVFVFVGAFYKVKVVEKGIKGPENGFATAFLHPISAIRTRRAEKKANSDRSSSEHGEGAVGLSDLPPKRRTVLIATVEYNIDDWNIKVKIGGLGVMAQLMGKALGHQDLIWVVPCVGDIEYPEIPEEMAEPMTVDILDAPYQVMVSYHVVENITYVLLDAPIFRQQTKAEPYPPRMDNIDSAIYYSAWNQCIAETIRRFPVDIYHINDYHGGIAPLYLLPDTIPCCLSLHNAEFQGLWPLRTPEERKEVCGVFSLTNDIVQQYVQFGSVFNLLHGAVSYLRIHQNGYGAVGVSKKYGDRSFARYPIFWGLSQIGQLPNPDPSDMEAWSAKEPQIKDVSIDQNFEASRPDLRRQAQEWAGLEVNPKADLFVFVGRWSQQKGVDLIADLFPTILEEYPNTQLICVGPTIDLYGKFAALKLEKLMEIYPKRVFSKPQFTSLPPYIFSGAEFALIPSRDEPFGLVAVEFGRKGALGVGAKVGGLGQMPGWWYTIESASTTHLLSQFKQAIVSALDSKEETRAKMRAWSAKQRFPVAQWLEGLEKLQGRSIKIHKKMKTRAKRTLNLSGTRNRDSERNLTPLTPGTAGMFPSRPSSPSSPWPLPPSRGGLDSRPQTPTDFTGSGFPDLGLQSPAFPSSRWARDTDNDSIMSDTSTLAPPRFLGEGEYYAPDRSLGGRHNFTAHNNGSTMSIASVVSVDSIVQGRKDFKLQQVDAFFTDQDGQYYQAFERRLDKLNSKNSTSQLCIEEYLMKSEKQFFERMHDAKLGSLSRNNSSTNLIEGNNRMSSLAREYGDDDDEKPANEFGLSDDYIPPTGIKKVLSRRLGEWPIYAMLMALGQVIASSSYQISLLTGEMGQSAQKLYIIAGIYLATSICWGIMSRTMRAIYCLSLPWIFYGLAFVLIGAAPLFSDLHTRAAVQNLATGLYAAGSSSGAIFFSFNFGDEGGAPVTTWIFRACVIQGFQQAYTVALWFWGNLISTTPQLAKIPAFPVLLPVTIVVAIFLWGCGLVLFLGLPDYYRQQPDEVPSLYSSILRRKTTVWFFVAVILQNFFLSTPYGRNWFYLFSSQHVSTGVVLALTAFFYIVVWAGFLAFFALMSKRHPWWLPLFALGLGAPRWAQMLWGTSGFGLYLPWAGSATASAILGRCLWLWLGLLDTIQNAGLGMILMLTLTRIHVSVTMLSAQVIGSAATMVARACAPNNVGPGDVFPDFSQGLGFGLSKAWFWVGLILQLVICVGFFKFFRKEQISKP